MIDIERLAKEFRYATEAACENGEMRKHPPFSGFPNECCDLTCDLLGQYLFENNIETNTDQNNVETNSAEGEAESQENSVTEIGG